LAAYVSGSLLALFRLKLNFFGLLYIFVYGSPYFYTLLIYFYYFFVYFVIYFYFYSICVFYTYTFLFSTLYSTFLPFFYVLDFYNLKG